MKEHVLTSEKHAMNYLKINLIISSLPGKFLDGDEQGY